MSSDGSDLLERFHIALVAAIEGHKPEYLRGPFSVSEIYQDLVPYRTHRDLIGVALNGDYEDALMRLLAGEGGYLILESSHAREAIAKEMESRNPNTGLFREYAAASVRLNPAFVDAPAAMASDGPLIGIFEEVDAVDEMDAADEMEAVVRGMSDGQEQAVSELEQVTVSVAPEPTAPPAEEQDERDPEWGFALPHEEDGVAEEEDPSFEEVLDGPAPQFWRERSGAHPPLQAHGPAHQSTGGSSDAADDAGTEGAGALAEENRRLKLLLAERILEIQELQERLRQLIGSRGDAHR